MKKTVISILMAGILAANLAGCSGGTDNSKNAENSSGEN